MAEQLICNQQVDGSTPFTSSKRVPVFDCNSFHMGEFPSGQRGQTVNLLSLTSLVRIQLPPPKKNTDSIGVLFLSVKLSARECWAAYRRRRATVKAISLRGILRYTAICSSLISQAERPPQSSLRVATDSFPHRPEWVGFLFDWGN